ncbi:hypothetical protein MSPP1_003577 [Malassezia sp. CBS 17886]|nr:hypothetical protein MSPP1_003577 [Malassezia sp. CBS 17886]
MDKGKGAVQNGAQPAPEKPGASVPRTPSTMTEDMRALLASQAKAGSSAGATGGTMINEAMRDMRVSDTGRAAHTSAGAVFREGGSRTPTKLSDGDAEFGGFARGEFVWDDRIGDSLSSGAAANPSFMEQAWTQGVSQHHAAPAAAPPRAAGNSVPASAPPAADAASFLAALGAEEQAPESVDAPQLVPMADVRLEDAWRPPSPSMGTAMSAEQYAMHEQLAMRQTGVDSTQPYRAAEALAPAPDDAALEEGVFARTPEAALQSVWSTQGTRAARVAAYRRGDISGAQVASLTPYTRVRGQAIVDRLRGWLVRDGYTEEVYGLPPAVTQTFGEATMETSSDKDEERRAKAIRRLDALYRHLSAPGAAGGGGGDAMEQWLQQHRGPA